MTKASGTLTLLTVLLFVVSAFAADKVVVVPLTRCADGLTKCSGQCVDTMNNPNYCGNCTTDCGTGNYCNNGTCKKEVSQACTEDTECLTGKCSGNVCVDVKFVFTSSVTYSGNLGGLSGADSKCQALAQDAGLPGVFKAWLSSSTQSPYSRFNRSPLDYVLVDGSVIANGWSDLTDGTLDGPIMQDEYGTSLSGQNCHPWTNTDSDGTRASTVPSGSCNDWSSENAALTTITGYSGYADSQWTNLLSNQNCAGVPVNLGCLFCFEQ